jgi:hypothetical protein
MMAGDKPEDLRGVEDRDDDVDEELDEDLDDDAPPGADRERGFASKMIGDLARRALMTGIGAVFMSEDALRGSLSEMKLPKEAMNYVVGQADRTKKEIVTAIARETREFLSKLEVDKVLARALVGTTIEIQTRIRVLPKGEGMGAAVESTETRMVKTGSSDDEGEGEKKKRGRRRRRSDAGEPESE